MKQRDTRWLCAAVLCCVLRFVCGDTAHRRHGSRSFGHSALSIDKVEAFWTSHRSPPLVRTHQFHHDEGRVEVALGQVLTNPLGEVIDTEDFDRMSSVEKQEIPDMNVTEQLENASDSSNSTESQATGNNAAINSSNATSGNSSSGGSSTQNATSGSSAQNATNGSSAQNATNGSNSSDVIPATTASVGMSRNETTQNGNTVPAADGPLADEVPGSSPSNAEPQRPAIGQSAPAGRNLTYGEYSSVVHFNIMCVASGLYLREDPAILNKFRLKCEKLNPDDPSFRFRFVAETDGRWRIRATASHHYLWEYDVDHEVRGTESVADEFTSFSMEPQADWSYKFRVKANNHYLYQDSTTNILAGGDITDDYANFKLVALESAASCKAYQFQSVCPPNRCWWLKDHCEFSRDDIHAGVTRSSCWKALACIFVILLGYA